MGDQFLLIIAGIGIALIFDFTNGVHDAANSIATIVSTRVLTPRQAVVWAAFFNFLAFVIFGTEVAKTIGQGLIDISIVTPIIIVIGIVGAIVWNIITWCLGLPTSSSHALMGGYAGAAIAASGFQVLILSGWYKILVFMIFAPILGLMLGVITKIMALWVFHKKSPLFVDRLSRHLQIISAALYSLGHGGNDAQKTIGIITGLLVSGRIINSFDVPLWVILSAHTAIALGTLMGGWKIVKTMGSKITRLQPLDGFCAETSGAFSLFLSTYLGIPVSTTHVITGAISGVGSVRRISAVRWHIARKIVWAWLFTIPFSASIAWTIYSLFSLIF